METTNEEFNLEAFMKVKIDNIFAHGRDMGFTNEQIAKVFEESVRMAYNGLYYGQEVSPRLREMQIKMKAHQQTPYCKALHALFQLNFYTAWTACDPDSQRLVNYDRKILLDIIDEKTRVRLIMHRQRGGIEFLVPGLELTSLKSELLPQYMNDIVTKLKAKLDEDEKQGF